MDERAKLKKNWLFAIPDGQFPIVEENADGSFEILPPKTCTLQPDTPSTQASDSDDGITSAVTTVDGDNDESSPSAAEAAGNYARVTLAGWDPTTTCAEDSESETNCSPSLAQCRSRAQALNLSNLMAATSGDETTDVVSESEPEFPPPPAGMIFKMPSIPTFSIQKYV